MSSHWRRLAILVVVASTVVACGRSERPNVLLISLDTLRADSLGSYGYALDTTPFLDQLAGRGVRFDNAFVNSLPTTPSHVTLLASQYQESHGVLWEAKRDDPALVERIPAGVPMLQEVMAADGYRTLAVTDGGNFGERQGFARGWDEFHGKRAKGVVVGSESLLSALEPHLAAEQPLFVLYHTYEIHAPYDPPEPYRTIFGELPDSDFRPTAQNLRAVIDTAARDLSAEDLAKTRQLYDAGIRFTDDQLRSLFGALEERGFFAGDYLVVVFSDHGEEFGERGGVLHRGLLYDEFIKVPLLFSAPRLPRGEVRQEMVSAVDVAPTILAYAGVGVPESMQGRDLFTPAGRRSRAGEMIFAQFRNRRYAVRTQEWKFISSGALELYDLRVDPGETRNVALRHLDKVEEFRDLLERWRAAQEGRRPEPGDAVPLSDEQLDELRALGYVN